jgi:hypothetical protein
VGTIGRYGVVFFWGNSGNGKTSAVMSFCNALCSIGMRGIYLSKEEGVGLTMQNTLRRFRMSECGSNFQINEQMSLEALDEKLAKPRSADFVVIDSIQYLQLSYKQFVEFKERHRKKLIILVSQASGRKPDGRPATRMMYDASLKIWVEGYTAFSKGRFIGTTGKCVIYDKGAQRYWEGKEQEQQQEQE